MNLPNRVLHFFKSHPSVFHPREAVLVACSGGPDSVGLVTVLKALSKQLPYRFHLGHINHRLRGQASNQDARFTAGLARRVGWPFHERVGAVSKSGSGNLEEKARVKRYALLFETARRFGCRALLTAHTEDDQLETLIMNLSRGTGPDGLVGIWPVRFLAAPGLWLARPFLEVSKSDVLDYLKAHNTSFRADSSNVDERLLRNWVRRVLLPLWQTRAPHLKNRLTRTAQILREEQVYWDQLIQATGRHVVSAAKGGAVVDQERLSIYAPAVQRRLLRQILGPDLLTFDLLEDLRAWMTSPPSNGRIYQLKAGWVAERLSKSKGFSSTKLFWFHQSIKNNRKMKKI